ncbi:MAG: VOC family protein [Blastocatellia bacterium]|nr:VOC family protein [Blastocatellia bacterium]
MLATGLFHAEAQETPAIGGVYEMVIGTSDLLAAVQYWEQFGYRMGKQGELSAEDAAKLYGVNSRVRSIRLYHQQADHGLIRLMAWEKPIGAGLGLSHMKVVGNRWGAMLTDDVYNLQNHAEDAQAAGMPIYLVPPQKAVIYPTSKKSVPFLEESPCVREMAMIQPLARQVMFQRFEYSLPLYGKVNESSHFRSSQITHFGMVVQCDKEALNFYDQVLGLLRVRDDNESTYESLSARNVFELQPGERYVTTDFDDPRSSKTDMQKARSGRLKIVRFPPDVRLPNKLPDSRPGVLGPSLYTYRVRGIEQFQTKVKASAAKDVTNVFTNEFGEKSFSFVAPDGYSWTLLE